MYKVDLEPSKRIDTTQRRTITCKEPVPLWNTDEYEGCKRPGECTSDFLRNVWNVGPGGWPEKVPDAFNRQIRISQDTMWFKNQINDSGLMKCYKEWFFSSNLELILNK